jgi:dCMP deaminase
MSMAYLVSTRATCDRKHVGAVLVKDNRVVATGYNGSPSGTPHCDDEGHVLKNIEGRDSCIRTLHAESNAIDFAGRDADGCSLYTTVVPCYDCAKRIINAGVDYVFYDQHYQSRSTELVAELFEA